MNKYFSAALLIVLTSILVLWNTGSILSAPIQVSVGKPPPDLNAEVMVFNGVHGWYVPGGDNRHCILLMHGIRSDRRGMIARARFLKNAGYASLLIDLQAHGETPGEQITFGYLESDSARSAIDYLRHHKQCQKVASIGQSLGGAASLLGETPINVDAYILEAVYPTVENAVYNRLALRMGIIAHFVAPLLYYQIPLRFGIPLNALRPVDAIRNINTPVLIIAGSNDQHTTAENSRWIYDHAPLAKKFWLIENAGHTDFYRFTPERYKQVTLLFLDKTMGTERNRIGKTFIKVKHNEEAL